MIEIERVLMIEWLDKKHVVACTDLGLDPHTTLTRYAKLSKLLFDYAAVITYDRR